jgi:hypothetical protein
MKWRIREGFTLFNSPEEAIEYRCGSRAVRPLAVGGDVIAFTPTKLQSIKQGGLLGKLEPFDDEAIKYFGDTRPIVSRLITHPEEFIQRPPEKAA